MLRSLQIVCAKNHARGVLIHAESPPHSYGNWSRRAQQRRPPKR
jgi:hypothetical protein